MPEEIILTTFQFHRGTVEAFTRNNPILACGEPSYALSDDGAHIFKIGDGETPWVDLPLANEAQMNALLESYKASAPAISADGYWIVDGEKTEVKAEGKTPIKGVDYYTEAEKAELLNELLTAYPPAKGVKF